MHIILTCYAVFIVFIYFFIFLYVLNFNFVIILGSRATNCMQTNNDLTNTLKVKQTPEKTLITLCGNLFTRLLYKPCLDFFID